MKEKSTATGSRVKADFGRAWRRSHDMGCSGCCSRVLEEEVDGVLGRDAVRAARRRRDAPPGYRNGFGKPRRLSLSDGNDHAAPAPGARAGRAVREPGAAPVRAAHRGSGRLLPELYLHGLAQGDFDLAMRGLLGEEAPLSAAVDRATQGGVATGV